MYLEKRAGILSYSCYKQIFDTDPAKWYAQSEKYALHKLLPSHTIKQFWNTHCTHKSWLIYGTYISRLIHGMLMFLMINSWLIQDIQNSFLLFTVSRIPCSFVVRTNWGTGSGTSKECILTCCCIPFVAQFIPGWNVAMTLGGWSSQLEEVEAEEIIHPVRVPPIRLCCTLYTRGVLCDYLTPAWPFIFSFKQIATRTVFYVTRSAVERNANQNTECIGTREEAKKT